MKHQTIKAASVNLTAIMERDNITKIDRHVYESGEPNFSVTIAGQSTGYGKTVGEAYDNALGWADIQSAA